MSVLLTIDGLTLEVAGRVLMRGLSLVVAEGDRIAALGPSGSGKTTLLRALAGLDDPAAGTIAWRGGPRDVAGWPAYRRQVLYLPQRSAFRDHTVGEALARPFGFASMDAAFSEPRARALLDALGLPATAWGQQARALSEGERQRVALARALLLEPACLLADEPTAALDAASREVVEAHLAAVPALVLVTHDPDQAARLATRPPIHLRGPADG